MAGRQLPLKAPCCGTCCDLSGFLSFPPAVVGTTEIHATGWSHPNGASAPGSGPLALASGFLGLPLPRLGEAITAAGWSPGVAGAAGEESPAGP